MPIVLLGSTEGAKLGHQVQKNFRTSKIILDPLLVAESNQARVTFVAVLSGHTGHHVCHANTRRRRGITTSILYKPSPEGSRDSIPKAQNDGIRNGDNCALVVTLLPIPPHKGGDNIIPLEGVSSPKHIRMIGKMDDRIE